METHVADGIFSNCFGKQDGFQENQDFSPLLDSPVEELSEFLHDHLNIRIGPYETHYKMDHPNRGKAIIFNHEHFTSDYNTRTGTHVDCNRISKILEYIGFDVKICNDYKLKRVLKTVKKVAKKDHSKSDCILIIIMSHGGLGSISASDFSYRPELLYNCFTADNCPSLIDKPKLFFIQACRGDKFDAGTTLQTVPDSSPKESEPMVYTEPDFLIVYSTIPGFYSWRSPEKGSWFIQELCDELDSNIFDTDILKLLTHVNFHVAVKYESNVPQEITMHRQKQIPCINSTLTRILQFKKQ